MAAFKPHKVVAALPTVLEPDSLYFVRRGTGVDLYVTNSIGTVVACPMNGPKEADLSASRAYGLAYGG